ncbi:cellulase family glycosylhydrolase [Gordonia jinghuaiqii]|uniref:Cellulase family glycosylhydrolase n=1 Tax=Gordonia jinghuaiqii TaxID=2758710 RepID=A0A7D7LSU7_9ACTN|nr:cellulase family glycosylhydrolase [Gordonia jinghuaiqii]MCR5977931.1 cellulase family glycosylhydrolase [Gordonia jinghuaiqii]QMT02585.1 cellulase family glycosylhydrolase [Gordonia jinghuaiqii]
MTIVGVALTMVGTPTTSHAATRIPIGVASVSTQYSGADFEDEAAKIRATGASAIRISAKWNLIQPSNSTSFSWTRLDSAVNAARGRGLSILMNLEGPAPVWAQKPGANPFANGNAPANPATFGEFARQVALRYSPRVAAWEIWNEPNLSHYLLPPTADQYVPLLKAAFNGIRAAGGHQAVITGGLSSSRAETRDTAFVNGLYALGAKNYFNGIGVHPYTLPYPITGDPRGGDGGGAAVLPAARATMVANGDSGKSIWVTEFGQPTGTTPSSTTEAVQATIITDAVNRANALPWVAAFFIFNSQDLSANKADDNMNFGLYRFNGSPKPVVGALQGVLGAPS